MIKLKQILFEKKNDKEYLTSDEKDFIKNKFGEVSCSFAKNKKNNKYFCYTHRARSKYYKNLDDIPKKVVDFISSTS